MVIPTSVDEFLAAVTCRAVTESLSAQDAVRGCWEESAGRNRACLAALITAQRAGMLATFDAQNAVIVASQTMLDAGIRSSSVLVDPPARHPRLRIVSRRNTQRKSEPSPMDDTHPLVQAQGLDKSDPIDWATSGLNFRPPLWDSGYPPDLDERDS